MPLSKPFADMPADELIAEWRHWDQAIANAKGWGAALAAADEFRRACEMHLKRLGAWPPVPAASVGEAERHG